MKREDIVVGENTEYPLNGMLTLPDNTDTPVPAVVLVHGSGMSDMDESVGYITPFKDLAYGLAEHGIASIRYDKRTLAHMSSMMQNKDLIISVKEETTEDALLATELLRNDPRIDKDNIFIIGHNLGGMMAPRIDDEGGNYKGLILIGSTPRKLEEILIDQNKDAYNKMNFILKLLYGGSSRSFNTSFRGIYNLTDEKAKKKMLGTGATAYYFKDIGEHTIEAYLDKLHKPMLIMQGDQDKQVKVEKDFNAYKELLKDRDNVTFKLYENINHLLVDHIKHSLLQYGEELHISEEIVTDIASWIKETV